MGKELWAEGEHLRSMWINRIRGLGDLVRSGYLELYGVELKGR